MMKQPTPTPGESSEVVTLAKVIKELTHQVRELAAIMDEIREDLLGAVRKNRLDPCMTQRMVDVSLEDEEEAEDEDSDPHADESPVPPPCVRLTGSHPQKTQPTLFS